MVDLYYWPTPNGKKVTIFLEETGLPYKLIPLDIGKGDQFDRSFLKINPNHRMPAIVDHAPNGGGVPISVFESGAILLYLAEKTGSSGRRSRISNTRSCNGSSGRWRTRGPSSANAVISAGWATSTVTSPMPSAASRMRRTGSTAC
ncbi:MAG: glutathione S-transferase N-terminal domain-containing protein [Aliidongia sp.]